MSYGRSRAPERAGAATTSTETTTRAGKHTLTEMAFPHGDVIASAVGVAVPGRAVLDPDGCRARGVPAYSDRDVSHFASASPSLHVAAHEAAHLLQHAGRTGDVGLGAERHAHEVAEAVASQMCARHLLGGGASVAPAVRDYTEFDESDQAKSGQWKTGGSAFVADDGRTVTTNANKHACYADPALIQEAGAILAAKQSGVRIGVGLPGPSGLAPDGSGFKQTSRVDYTIMSDSDNEEYWADCSRAARETMGTTGTDPQAHGVYRDGAGKTATTHAVARDPESIRDMIYVRSGLGANGSAAHAAYNSMSADQHKDFDEKHGINKYAAPNVGQAFTRRRDDSMTDARGYNYHWGGVILVAGGDRVVFENFAKPGKENYDRKDEDWRFFTYGPPTKKGQTFHEQWRHSVGGKLDSGTTVATATSADPTPHLAAMKAMSIQALIKKYRTATDEAERLALDAAMRQRWLKVTVHVKDSDEDEDEVYVVAKHGDHRFESNVKDMKDGDREVFWISLNHLAPITGPITVKVYDEDDISDDLMSEVELDDPYALRSDFGSRYRTDVELDR